MEDFEAEKSIKIFKKGNKTSIGCKHKGYIEVGVVNNA